MCWNPRGSTVGLRNFSPARGLIDRKQQRMPRLVSSIFRGRVLGRLLICHSALLVGSVACGESVEVGIADVKLVAEAWPEADALFHRDPRWLGGDDAYSVDLRDGRVAWFFGDSFVAPSVAGQRRGTTMVRNSVGIQTGYDPTSAQFKCYWREEDGKPASFIPEDGENFYWPGGNLLLDGKLLVLFMRARNAEEELHFATTGWGAVLIDNLQMEPEHWEVRKLTVPQNKFGVLVGSASLVRDEQYVYALSVQQRSHDVFLVRWPSSDASKGDLADPQWWTGEETGWVPQRDLAKLPTPLLTRGHTEFTVHSSKALACYLQVQFTGYPRTPIGVRSAGSLTGPWSRLQALYWPEEIVNNGHGLMLYAAKAHPEQSTDGLALTYCSNTFRFTRVLDDNKVYFPRFVRVRLERAGQ